MFLGGFAQNKRANTSSFFNTNSNKSKTDHSSGHKGGFLLNYVGNDSLSENSSSKPQVDLEKYKSLLDSQTIIIMIMISKAMKSNPRVRQILQIVCC